MGKLLNISIVLYKTPEDEWKPLVEELLRSKKVHTIYLIDNSPEDSGFRIQDSEFKIQKSVIGIRGRI